jgi:competence protein ComEC
VIDDATTIGTAVGQADGGRSGPGEVWPVLVAVSFWVGADLAPEWLARPSPVLAVLVLVFVVVMAAVVASRRRRRSTGQGGRSTRLLLALWLAATSLTVGGHRSASAAAAYQQLEPGPLNATVELLSDPEPFGSAGWRAELRLPDGSRVEATAWGATGTALARLTIGHRLAVTGRIKPVGDRPWLQVRHVVARVDLTSLEPAGGPPGWRRTVEAIRSRVAAGGRVLDDRDQALYLGLVLGDDRFQPLGQRLSFRLAGLTHLLAVSGQNVAFVLAVAAPALSLVGRRVRLALVIGLLVLFALVTRLEPSVLRAAMTAGLSAWAVATGRARTGPAVLAVAVVLLVAVDPFLVKAVGFQLSVAASAGILVIGPPLAARLPGPQALTSVASTTIAAQLGVAPVLAHHFDSPSLVTVPANLAAGWAAAGVMTWGLTGGVVAGLLPDQAAAVVQIPARLMLGWLELVAHQAVRLPGPRPGPGTAVVLAGLLVVGAMARKLTVLVPVAALGGVLLVATVPQPSTGPTRCGNGVVWLPEADAAPSILVVEPGAGGSAVEACRRAGVRQVDVMIVEDGSRRSGEVVQAAVELIDVGVIRAPALHRVVGAQRVVEPEVVPTAAGPLTMMPSADGLSLSLSLTPALHVAPP